MRQILIILAALFVTIGAQAQIVNGRVIDAETARPLSQAVIVNLANSQTTVTDDSGRFMLPAKTGDNLSISFTGYHNVQMAVSGDIPADVALHQLSVRLREVVVHDLTQFQKDSIAMTETYSKELNKHAVKPGFSSANGGGFSGLIGGPIQKISRSYKQNKRFKENFKHDMEQRYIDTKYTATLVQSLTNYTGDTLAVFMNTYNMDYDFARHATELEMKMWIRDNYKTYDVRLKKEGFILKDTRSAEPADKK